MNIVVIGGVAGGTTAAAKARRNAPQASIKIFEKGKDISYAGCGLPYYIGDPSMYIKSIVPRDSDYFKRRYGIDVYTRHNVLAIDPQQKKVSVQNLETGEIFQERYDKLIISTGAKPFIPQIDGIDPKNVFALRNVANADAIRDYIEINKPEKALIVGTGFIGIELAENLKARGMSVTFVEMVGQVMPALDEDMALHLESYLRENGFEIILNDTVSAFEGSPVNSARLRSGKMLETDLVILATGVKPEVELAANAGIELGPTGAIKVSKRMETSINDIYACGDCAESYSAITGRPIYRPLGTTANKTGRVAGDRATGGNTEFGGILGTSIFKVLDKTVAQTGLTEKEALREGFEVVVSNDVKPNRPQYMGSTDLIIKAVADRKTGRVLGVQIIGGQGVDKRIDVFATAIFLGARYDQLVQLDLAYSPFYSTTNDPVHYTGMIFQKSFSKE